MRRKARTYDIESLMEEMIPAKRWKEHVVEDLMKFWDKPEITNIKDGLFPTYITNQGQPLPQDMKQWPKEFQEAYKSEETKGLIDTEKNYVRAHSRLTYAFGIGYHITGNPHYLEVCRKGALALLEAIDGNYGMHVTNEIASKSWDEDYKKRTSQDLAYGLTGLGMYYFLTHDATFLYRILQLKDFIFRIYMDDSRGYLTWYPGNVKEQEVQIVAQLDQLYAYMLMLTPSLPEPFKTQWKRDMKKVVDILMINFYSEEYGFFWGMDNNSVNKQLGTDHTDFGHSVKTLWVIQKVGQLLGKPYYIEFARPKIHKILKEAYIKENGTWGRRFDNNGNLDINKEWWILAELGQACQILAMNDPSYYRYLNPTQKYWLETMVDKEHGEIWHMVDGNTHIPMIHYPKAHSWKTSLHSFEHALFSYMTAADMKGEDIRLYYALPEWEQATNRTVSPYMFFADVKEVKEADRLEFMPDNNRTVEVAFRSLH